MPLPGISICIYNLCFLISSFFFQCLCAFGKACQLSDVSWAEVVKQPLKQFASGYCSFPWLRGTLSIQPIVLWLAGSWVAQFLVDEPFLGRSCVVPEAVSPSSRSGKLNANLCMIVRACLLACCCREWEAVLSLWALGWLSLPCAHLHRPHSPRLTRSKVTYSFAGLKLGKDVGACTGRRVRPWRRENSR